MIGCVFRFYIISFIFFKQNPAYERRISDWSSDVCSSDLIASLPCRCTRRLLRRAICVFDLPLQAGDGLGACPQVARERWITRGRAQSRHGGCTKALKQPARPDQTARDRKSGV